jgi:hypothetical protein
VTPEGSVIADCWRLTGDSEMIRLHTKELYLVENPVMRREVRLWEATGPYRLIFSAYVVGLACTL